MLEMRNANLELSGIFLPLGQLGWYLFRILFAVIMLRIANETETWLDYWGIDSVYLFIFDTNILWPDYYG